MTEKFTPQKNKLTFKLFKQFLPLFRRSKFHTTLDNTTCIMLENHLKNERQCQLIYFLGYHDRNWTLEHHLVPAWGLKKYTHLVGVTSNKI